MKEQLNKYKIQREPTCNLESLWKQHSEIAFALLASLKMFFLNASIST